MSDTLHEERERIHGQLDTALDEIRHGSLADGIAMVETVRDELERRVEQQTLDDIEDTEE